MKMPVSNLKQFLRSMTLTHTFHPVSILGFIGLAFMLASTQALAVDTDEDDVDDALDNCTLTANTDQRDTDADGYGNLCDGDLNNDGSTNSLDLNIYKLAHRTVAGDANYNVDADFNGDDVINTLDLNIYNGLHRQPPGPSCVDNPGAANRHHRPQKFPLTLPVRILLMWESLRTV